MYSDRVVEPFEKLALADLCHYAVYSGAGRVISTYISPVYSSQALAVFRTYGILPIRLPSTPAVAKNWVSMEPPWPDAINGYCLRLSPLDIRTVCVRTSRCREGIRW